MGNQDLINGAKSVLNNSTKLLDQDPVAMAMLADITQEYFDKLVASKGGRRPSEQELRDLVRQVQADPRVSGTPVIGGPGDFTIIAPVLGYLVVGAEALIFVALFVDQCVKLHDEWPE